MNILEGVKASRCIFNGRETTTVACTPRDILWITTLEGVASCNPSFPSGRRTLHRADSTLVAWPREAWQMLITPEEKGAVAAVVFKITLDALHALLAVDYSSDSNNDSPQVDYSTMARTVHLSPVLIRNLERIFLYSEDSLFTAMSRRGIFLETFAEILSMLFGQEIARCPFHIDSDTERKIRVAQQVVVDNLHDTPDLHQLALDVELPRQVLKEGFAYLYGKPMPAYIQDYKFEKARTMLESGKYLIKEIAFAVGYQNPSHFISAFKQRYGITPKQWSKQLQESYPNLNGT